VLHATTTRTYRAFKLSVRGTRRSTENILLSEHTLDDARRTLDGLEETRANRYYIDGHARSKG
jgi:hypothetical protein